MAKSNKKSFNSHGISVITPTKRASYIDKLFQNYARQNWDKKELIIIINRNDIEMDKYVEMSEKYENVSVYRLPETISLGSCLNSGVRKAKYNYIARFDDDDYYAPNYLKEAMKTFKKTNADVIGKKSFFIWLSENKKLVLRFPESENKRVSILPGATLVIKRHVFEKLKFPEINVGEDDRFCMRCKAYGFKLYSGGKYNFVAIRRKYSFEHTWIINEKAIMRRAKIYGEIKNYKEYITR